MIAYDNSLSGAGNASTSFTVDTNSPILIACSVENTSSFSYGGQGFTSLADFQVTAGGARIYVYYLATPASGANTFAVTGQFVSYSWAVISIKDANRLNPIDTSNTKYVGSSTSSISNNITPGVDNAFLVSIVGGSVSLPFSVGTDQTRRQQNNAGSDSTLGVSTRGPVSPAASTSMDWTFSSSNPAGMAIISISPVATKSGLLTLFAG